MVMLNDGGDVDDVDDAGHIMVVMMDHDDDNFVGS